MCKFTKICEASFSYDQGDYCAVDILRRTPDGWAIYEVKSTTCKVSDITLENPKIVEKVQKYAPDIAFQEWVLEQCGVNGSFRIKIVLPDLFPNDTELNYHNINHLVQNGGQAMTIFPQMREMSAEKVDEDTSDVPWPFE